MIRSTCIGRATQLEQSILQFQPCKQNVRCLSSKKLTKCANDVLICEIASHSSNSKSLLNVFGLMYPVNISFLRSFHSKKHRSGSPTVKSWQPSFFPKSKEAQQKEEQEQLLEHTRGILKSERSRAKNAFQERFPLPNVLYTWILFLFKFVTFDGSFFSRAIVSCCSGVLRIKFDLLL